MMTPADHTMTMGPTFSRWEYLTDEYRQGLEALRRGDTSGSKHMMQLAREIQALSQRCVDAPYSVELETEPEPETDWSASELEALASPSAWSSMGQRVARIFSTMQA